MAKELDLKPLGTEIIAHTVFGGAQLEATPHSTYKVKVSATSNRYRSEQMIEFLSQEKLYGEIPRIPKKNLCKEFKKNRLRLSDIGQGNTKIEVLIGRDFYGRLLTGRIKQFDNGLTAIETKLGWTICGRSSQSDYMMNGTAVLMTNLSIYERMECSRFMAV